MKTKVKKSSPEIAKNNEEITAESLSNKINRRKALENIVKTGMGILGFGGIFSKLIFYPSMVSASTLEGCTSSDSTCRETASCSDDFQCPDVYSCLGIHTCETSNTCKTSKSCPNNDSCTSNLVPVTLTSFNAINFSGKIALQWVTETEVNNYGFNIHRGVNKNGQFKKVTESVIPGAGNSNIRHYYKFLDKHVEEGCIYWYMLEEISTDGTSSMHGPIQCKVEVTVPDKFVLHPNFPNPFNSETNFYFDLPNPGTVDIDIFDLLGGVIKHTNMQCNTGLNQWRWNAINDQGGKVATGNYICCITFNGNSQSRKISYMK